MKQVVYCLIKFHKVIKLNKNFMIVFVALFQTNKIILI
jgi:hypothetical protein